MYLVSCINQLLEGQYTFKKSIGWGFKKWIILWTFEEKSDMKWSCIADPAAVLGGQNPVEIWLQSAPGIDLSNATYMDSAIKAIIDKASEGYNSGTYATADDAIQYIKDEVASGYKNITVE